jgi:rubrerythrin
MAILEKTVRVFKCNICGYEWQRKKKNSKAAPRICPECKNPRWNKAVETAKSCEQLINGSDRPTLNQ